MTGSELLSLFDALAATLMAATVCGARHADGWFGTVVGPR
jgi:hypothetical protein